LEKKFEIPYKPLLDAGVKFDRAVVSVSEHARFKRRA
jgi:hypothetical protein